eukprot:111742-Amphidinium_carterae.1
MVRALEDVVVSSACDADAVIAGQALFCLYARARWSDAMHVESLELDKGDEHFFIQAAVRWTKTSGTTSHKHDFLPLTAVGFHLRTPWVHKWLDLRSQMGLKFGEGIPMLPVLLMSGAFGAAPMSTSEATVWLQEFLLQRGFGRSEVSKVATHSLKATTLSWCCKYGIAREVRQILGYHSVP